jgi:hypothetical protein
MTEDDETKACRWFTICWDRLEHAHTGLENAQHRREERPRRLRHRRRRTRESHVRVRLRQRRTRQSHGRIRRGQDRPRPDPIHARRPRRPTGRPQRGNSMSDQGPDPRAAYEHGYQDGQASRKAAAPGPGRPDRGRLVWGIVWLAIIVIALRVGLPILVAALHAWWVDTHCTMILGTQVCQN